MSDPRIQNVLPALGFIALKPLQELCVSQILAAAEPEGDTPRRRLVILPTGYGKTACFLVPAALLPHPSLIIYPLRALMADQARRFVAAGIEVAVLIGGLTAGELESRLARIRGGACRVIIANPEILATRRVRECLARVRLSHLVVDEAHVIPQWGDSFRPAYRELADTIRLLAPDQVSAFTATADARAVESIRRFLGDAQLFELRAPCDRPEISYRVIRSPLPELTVQALLRSVPRPALVFVRNRSVCESLSLRFRHADRGQRESIRFYHAGLSRSERGHLEHWFFHAGDAVLVSTNAYGLGVDKGDIRTVIHHGLPDSAASYLQESGRAGRDGQPAGAICVLGMDAPATTDPALALFAAGGRCRRSVLLEAVDCRCGRCAGCDVCQSELAGPGPEMADIQRFLKSNPSQFTLAEIGRELHRSGSLGYLGQAQIRALLQAGLLCGQLRESRSPFSWRRLKNGTGPR